MCHETGQVTAYAVEGVQQRGRLFVTPGEQVYEGQVVGIHQRSGDLKVSWQHSTAQRSMWQLCKATAVLQRGLVFSRGSHVA